MAEGPRQVIVADRMLVQHWDVLQDEVPAELTKSGNAMFTNPQSNSGRMRIAGAGFPLPAVHHVIRGFGLGRVGHSGTN
jgi:hypothetical protein